MTKAKLGDNEAAMEAFKVAMSLDPENPMTKKAAEAWAARTGSQPIKPGKVNIPDWTKSDGGKVGGKLRQSSPSAAVDGNVTQLLRGMANDPRASEAARLASQAYDMMGLDLDRALAMADRAVEMDSNELMARFVRAILREKAGDADGALEDAKNLQREMPDMPEAFAIAAQAYERKGAWDNALVEWQKAAELGPAYKDRLKAFLTRYRAATGKSDGAAEKEGRADLLGSGASGFFGRWLEKDKGFPILLVAVLGLVTIGSLLFALRMRATAGAMSEAAKGTTSSHGHGNSHVPNGKGSDSHEEASLTGTLRHGKLEFKREIGEGGMGKVYEAWDRSLQRRVAVKVLRWGRGSDEDRARFLEEARLVAQLSHPNIVTIHEIFEERNTIHLVFEYIEGEPLDKLLERERRLSLEECAQLVKGICSALDFAQTRKMAHRDLKPSNIMVRRERGEFAVVKVTDFGIAKQATKTLSDFSQTVATGTPLYMAPEQYLGKTARETDIFALAVTIYESITGDPPFKADFLHALQGMKESRSYVRLAEQGHPAWLDELIHRSLDPNPQGRPHSATEFWTAFQNGLLSQTPS